MKWWPLLLLGLFVMGNAARRFFATGYRRGVPYPLELESIGGGHYLARAAARAFVAMRAKAATEGVFLEVVSAFRTLEEQAELERQLESGERSDPVARPGHSNHQQGVAVDLRTARGTNAAFGWLERNAHLFGFARTVRSEPWHWEYVEPWAEAAQEVIS